MAIEGKTLDRTPQAAIKIGETMYLVNSTDLATISTAMERRKDAENAESGLPSKSTHLPPRPSQGRLAGLISGLALLLAIAHAENEEPVGSIESSRPCGFCDGQGARLGEMGGLFGQFCGQSAGHYDDCSVCKDGISYNVEEGEISVVRDDRKELKPIKYFIFNRNGKIDKFTVEQLDVRPKEGESGDIWVFLQLAGHRQFMTDRWIKVNKSLDFLNYLLARDGAFTFKNMIRKSKGNLRAAIKLNSKKQTKPAKKKSNKYYWPFSLVMG